jgi:purine nucleosidase
MTTDVPIPLIIDCDPGADDAIALLLAIAHPEKFQILGITTVAGNVPLALTSRNARWICELAGADLNVYAGCPRPLVRPLVTAENVHGRTGLDGLTVREPALPLQPQHAVEWLISTLRQAPQPVTLATLGPLTNLAVALIQAPEIQANIGRVVVMGGAVTQGNITPSAEFNVYVDPHGAQVVLSAGLNLELVTLDLTHQAIANPSRMGAIAALNTPISQAVCDLLNHYGEHDRAIYGFAGPPLHDACVIGYLLAPEIFTSRPAYGEVELTSGLTLGRTVVDLWNVRPEGQPNNLTLVTEIDSDRFFELLTQALGRLPRLQGSPPASF